MSVVMCPNTRYSSVAPKVDEDVKHVYEAFLDGAPLPGREKG